MSALDRHLFALLRTKAWRYVLLITVDVILVNAAVMVSFLVRFNSLPPAVFLSVYRDIAIYFTGLSIAAFLAFQLYMRAWRYASIDDLLAILSAVTVSTIVFGVAESLAASPIAGFPRSVVVLTWVFEALFVGGVRFFLRIQSHLHQRWASPTAVDEPRVLLVGAGEAGAFVARELRKRSGLHAVGFVDDDPEKKRLRVSSLPVLGTCSDILEVIAAHRIDQVVITMPTAAAGTVRQVVDLCRKVPIQVKVVPRVSDVIDGRVSVSQVRDVRIEDLLGRPSIQIDINAIAAYLSGRVVLITGAGGSIGAELCRQVALFNPEQIVMLDHDENGIFEVSTSIAARSGHVPCRLVVADVREAASVDRAFDIHRPSIVFHAAAHKHVPLMEAYPDEAIKTNVLGTWNLVQAASRCQVDRFVFISTDKAVNPTNVMGASKRLAEVLVQSAGNEQSHFMSVRFGNVLGSRGSVVPLFQSQIERHGPVTVTHPAMERFFMTVSEAVELVIQAGALGTGGEIFVLDMGKPVRILELAENLIRLSGYEPETEIPIQFIGVRPGEKLTEEALTVQEGLVSTRSEMIYVVPPSPLSWEIPVPELVRRLVEAVETSSPEGAHRALSELVPTLKSHVTRSSTDRAQRAQPSSSDLEGVGGTGGEVPIL